jgi:aconitate hydratase
MARNSFKARDRLGVGETTSEVFRLDRVDDAARLPYSLKVLLANLLRHEDGTLVTAEQIGALGAWDPSADSSTDRQFTPALTLMLMQDFTGLPRRRQVTTATAGSCPTSFASFCALTNPHNEPAEKVV